MNMGSIELTGFLIALTFDYRLRVFERAAQKGAVSLEAGGLQRNKKFLGICDCASAFGRLPCPTQPQ